MEQLAETEMRKDPCFQCFQDEDFDEARLCLGCVNESHKNELREQGFPCVYPGANDDDQV